MRPTAGHLTIRGDQGPAFLSRDLDLWAYKHGVVLDFSRPGRPTDNASMSLADARHKIENWRRYDNEDQLHGTIGYKASIALMNPDSDSGLPSRASPKKPYSGGQKYGLTA